MKSQSTHISCQDIKYSFVICTFNGKNRIHRPLNSIAENIDMTSCELLVIDNCSTDDVAEFSSSILKAKNFSWKICSEPSPGLMRARQKGCIESKGEIIVFVDDDNYILNNWIPNLDEAFANKSIGISGAFPEINPDRTLPDWWEIFKVAYAVGNNGHNEGVIDEGIVFGAGLAIRRSILQEFFNTFHPPLTTGRIGKRNMAGDDSEICYAAKALGYDIFFQPKNRLIHDIDQDRIRIPKLLDLFVGFANSYPCTLVYSAKTNFITAMLRNFFGSFLLGIKALILFVLSRHPKSLMYRVQMTYRFSIVIAWLQLTGQWSLYANRRRLVRSLMNQHLNGNNRINSASL